MDDETFEHDLRVRLGRDAQIGEKHLSHSSATTVDGVIDYLVSRAYGLAGPTSAT